MVEHICSGRPGGTTILTLGGVASEGTGGPGGVSSTTIPTIGGVAAEGISGGGLGVSVCSMHADGTHGSNVPVSGDGGGRASCCVTSCVAVLMFTDLSVSTKIVPAYQPD